MSAERIPQTPPPPEPKDRPRLVLTEYHPRPDDAAQRLKATDRLFALCLIPAAGLIAVTCAVLGLADLNRAPRPSDRARPLRLQWYRPPVPSAPKRPAPPIRRPSVLSRPRLKVTPPSPDRPLRVAPSPSPPPTVPTFRPVPPQPAPMLRVSTPPRVPSAPPPTPRPVSARVPRPTPPPQVAPPAMSSGRPPSVGHTAHMGHGGPSFSSSTTAPVNVPLTGGGSLQPTAPTQFAPEPAAPPISARPAEAPKPVEAPRVMEAPKPKPVEEPKPKPVEQAKPAHYVGSVDSREASVDDGSIQTPDADGIDASGLNGFCVISFEVDESGHLSGVRVKKSCGSSEMDRRCADAVRHGRGIPAVQDHIAYRARGQYTFSL